MQHQSFFAVCAFALISACGGSSTGNSSDNGEVTLEDLISRAETIGETFEGPIDLDDETDFDFTPVANIPTSGTADYTGYAVVVYDVDSFTELRALGSATMVANFDDQTIRGGADNFFEIDSAEITEGSDITGQSIDGSLTFNLAQDGGENLYLGELFGEITFTDGDIAFVDLVGIGAFAGNDASIFGIDGFDQAPEEVGILLQAD